MVNKLKINVKYMILFFLIYSFIFQKVIQGYFPVFTYFDEIVALLCFFIVVTNFSKINKDYKKIIYILFFLLIEGLLSSFVFKYQSFKVVLYDLFLFCKFFFILLASVVLIDYNFIEKYKKNIKFHLNFITLVFFVATVLNYIIKYNPSSYRFGIMSNQIFYSHPTYLSAAIIFLFSFGIIVRKKIFNLSNLLLLIMLLTTMRFKSIAALIIALLISFYINIFNKKISVKALIFFGLVIICVCFNQFRYYFIDNDYARNALFSTSFKVANDHFPLGAGFGTYSSYVSGEYYSPLYYKYSLNSYYGLTPYNPAFVSDVFWPMIIGEFGYFGLLLFGILCILLFKIIQKEYTINNKFLYIAKVFVFIYLMISSTSESAFVNPIAVPFALLLGIINKKEDVYSNEKEY